MKLSWARVRGDDGGFSLIWIAMILTLLLGMAGFATDLGWIYLNTVRAQNAADAAALAGVVNLPGFTSKARSDAEGAARANGFDPGGADTLSVEPLPDNTLRTELSTTVRPFFMRLFGLSQFGITRESTAQFVEPIRLGPPNNCFGCSPGSAWAGISAPYTNKANGDPYSTLCTAASGPSSCSSSNPDYQRGGSYGGYYYGIAVGAGASNLTVELYDAGHNTRPPGDVETGDSGVGSTTHFQLHSVDTTPHDPTDNPAISACSLVIPPASGNYMNTWDPLCTVASLTEGIYVLHVWTSGNGEGSNNYSVRANASGQTPRVFALNDMSIFNNQTALTQLYLAEIPDVHAGRIFEISFFDAGDVGGSSSMTVRDPHGSGVTCSWEVWNHSLTSRIGTGSGACSWDTSSGAYDNEWIVARIDLPDDPTAMCNGSDCLWKMDLDLADPNERTTWRARVITSPVHLVTPTTLP